MYACCLSQRREVRQGGRADAVAAIARIALPGNADLETRERGQFPPPALDEVRLSEQVGNRGGNRCHGGAEDPRQAHQRRLNVEGWQRLALSDDPVDSRTAAQQADQRRRALEDDRAAALLHQRGVADEVHHVAQPLLGVQEDRPAFQGRAVPERLCEGSPRSPGVLDAPAPFVLGPAALEVAAQQCEKGKAVMGFGVVGLQTEGQVQTRLGLVQAGHFREDVGQVDVRRDIVGVEAKGLLKAGERLLRAALVAQPQTQVVDRRGAVGFKGKSLTDAGQRLVQLPLLLQHHAERIVRLGKVGLEANRLLRAGGRRLRLPQFLQHKGQVVMHLRTVGRQATSLLIASQRLFHLLLFLKDQPQVAVYPGGVGFEAKGVLEAGQGVVQLSLFLQRIPRLLRTSPLLGLRRRAVWKLATASSRRSSSRRTFPRFMWAVA